MHKFIKSKFFEVGVEGIGYVSNEFGKETTSIKLGEDMSISIFNQDITYLEDKDVFVVRIKLEDIDGKERLHNVYEYENKRLIEYTSEKLIELFNMHYKERESSGFDNVALLKSLVRKG